MRLFYHKGALTRNLFIGRNSSQHRPSVRCEPSFDIKGKFAEEQFEFSKHAVDQSILRQIRVQEIREAIANAQIIEDYPEDKYGPSCLIYGLTQAQRPIHVQCSYPSRSLIKIITVYEPNLQRWNDDFTQRRRSDDDK